MKMTMAERVTTAEATPDTRFPIHNASDEHISDLFHRAATTS